MMEPNPPKALKVILLGGSGVGKTSLVTRYKSGTFHENEVSTIAVDLHTFSVLDRTVQIYDPAGQENYRSITKAYYRKVDGIMFVYDIEEPSTLDRIERDIDDVISVIGPECYEDTTRMLAGNKCDMRESAAISTSQGERFARKHKMMFSEVSCKTGENVLACMEKLIQELIDVEKERKEKNMASPSQPEEQTVKLDKQTDQKKEKKKSGECC